MNRNLTGKKPTFTKSGPKNSPYRIMLWLALIILLGWFVTQVGIGSEHRFQPAFLPTPTPTRTADSYLMEADAHFNAGVVLDEEKIDAVEAYQQALELEPENAQAWAELARLLTYSSSLLPTQSEKIERMAEARQAAENAVGAHESLQHVNQECSRCSQTLSVQTGTSFATRCVGSQWDQRYDFSTSTSIWCFWCW